MKILNIAQAEEVGSFDVDEGIVSFKVDNNDETLEQALAWVAVQETMTLISGGEADGQFYTEEIPVKPGEEGYFNAVSEFLYDYGYYLDLDATTEAVEA